jgi:hypothetical protein
MNFVLQLSTIPIEQEGYTVHLLSDEHGQILSTGESDATDVSAMVDRRGDV